MPFSIILPLILQNLPAIIATGEAGIKWIASIRNAAQQAGVWTDALETAFVNSLLQDALGPEWQPDPSAATVTKTTVTTVKTP